MTGRARTELRLLVDRAVRVRQIEGRECRRCLAVLPPQGKRRSCSDTCRKAYHNQTIGRHVRNARKRQARAEA